MGAGRRSKKMIATAFNDFLNGLGTLDLGIWEVPWMSLIIWGATLIIIVIIYRLIIHYLKKQVQWRGHSPNVYNSVKFLLRVGVLIIVVIFTVSWLNIESSYVLMISGVFLTAITFASMKSINNVMAGIFIAITRPFTVGDYIKMGDLSGIVTEISLNHTKIKHRDASISLVPNLTCLTSEIHNYTISLDWYRDHINLLEKSIEKSYTKKKQKDGVKKAEISFHNKKLGEELKELKTVMLDIENIQQNFIKMKEDVKRRERTARERRRKERENKRTMKMEERAKDVFETTEKKTSNWPAYSIYVDDDKIVRYTFTLKLPLKEPNRNAKILSTICKEWADEFEITPRWRISGLGSRIEYEFIILTPDPYDIIHYYDEFVEDVYKEIYDRTS